MSIAELGRACSARITTRSPYIALALVLAVFAASASVVALRTPAWEAADEPSHVHNVETLAAGHWYSIPVDISKGHRGRPLELHQPPLYYLLLAGLQRLVEQPVYRVAPGPGIFSLKSRQPLFLHHSSRAHRSLLLARFANVLLGLLTIVLTFLTARQLSTDRWTPIVAASFAAFFPRFVFSSAFVTNDNLVNLLGAALAYCAVRLVATPSAWRAIAVGGVLGAIVLTKLSALPVFLVLIPALFARPAWRARAALLAWIAGATLVVCGWYLIGNTISYGDPLALAASQRYLQLSGGLGTFYTPYVIAHPLRLVFSDVPGRIFRGFWYTSGWTQFTWPTGISLALWVLLGGALMGLRRKTRATPLPERAHQIALRSLTVLVFAGFLSVWAVAFSTGTYEPRLALVALSALACLTALGLQHLRPPLRVVLPVILLCGTVFAIGRDVLSISWNA
jgi:4-amino-4-deoxy-L-arabinose transferase-like glycosyltransferase